MLARWMKMDDNPSNVARSPHKAKVAALKAKLQALEVDLEARLTLLNQVEKQNGQLRDTVDELSKHINHEIVNTIKADFLGHEVIQEKDVMGESADPLLQGATAIENAMRETTSAELKAKLNKAPTDEALLPQDGALPRPIVLGGYSEGADVTLGGAFMGQVTSSRHCFHVSLPIEGRLPAQLVLEALRALKASNPTVEEKKEEKEEGEGEDGEHREEEGEKEPHKLISMKVFESLEKIFEAECLLPGAPRPAAPVAPSEPSPEPLSIANMVKLADEAAKDGAVLTEANGTYPAPVDRNFIVERTLGEEVSATRMSSKTQFFSMEDDKAVDVADTSLAREKEEVEAYERAVVEVDHAGQRISKAEARVMEMTSQVKHLAEVNRASADRVALSQKQVQLLKEEVQKMLPVKRAEVRSFRSFEDTVTQSPKRDGFHDWLSAPAREHRTPPLHERSGTGAGVYGWGSTVSSSNSPVSKMTSSPGSTRKPLNRHVEDLQKLAEEMRSWGVVS